MSRYDITRSANTSAATISIPPAMEALLEKNRHPAGKLALLTRFRAGLTCAAQAVRLPSDDRSAD
ncbi:hypothetical protein LKL35_36880 [Streptomyces sp. ET3-23]|uniref:3-oxoacyl-[acyl-carrier-protein] synthase III C-terminal domain-containing protein n=1 Tax=Streptomyces sp. ET3-23 TaxID=2885643 RepID=UPI001D12E610|nr:hypothetical protein [Streptomyces sp. ET3-23]